VGADAGFDIAPPFQASSDVDQSRWASFVNEVEETYKDDSIMRREHKWLVFAVGEHPRLPWQPQGFRRFSAKITGGLAKNVLSYLQGVYRIAVKHFGARVIWWNELVGDDWGIYGWDEVHAAAAEWDPPKVQHRFYAHAFS
jgi:hypothetical protein